MTKKIVQDVFADFTWPAPYSVQDGVNDVEVIFPETILYFEEDLVPFLRIICGVSASAGMYTSLPDVMSCLIPGHRWTLRQGYVPKSGDPVNAVPSEKITVQMLRDHLSNIQKHLLHVIQGDHTWIAKHEQFLKDNSYIGSVLGTGMYQHPIYEKFIKGDQSWREDINLMNR